MHQEPAKVFLTPNLQPLTRKVPSTLQTHEKQQNKRKRPARRTQPPMPRQKFMPPPWEKEADAVADRVLKRIEISKIARRLQNRLALAQFKTKHGWEDLTLDTIEPKFEEELRKKKLSEGELLSDSSSSTSELPYPTRALMSSPLKATIFSDAIGSSGGGSTGHRKRTYMTSFDQVASSPSKRFRSSPASHRSITAGHGTWKEHRQLAQSSPIKPRRQQHFTTSAGPNVSFFAGTRQATDALGLPNYSAAQSDDDEDLPTHSFRVNSSNLRSSPPSTPPNRSRNTLAPRWNNANKDNKQQQQVESGEEGADLLLYLAASPSPANPPARANRMDPPPSTPPPKGRQVLPSSMMTTTPGGNLFPTTPGLAFDFSDFVHMTPSPAQKPWKTPVALPSAKTPMSVARRRLTFDDLP